MIEYLLLLAGRGFWVAFIVSALLALPILKLLVRLKSRQTVSEFVPEHAQKQGTPTMGGIIVVAGVLAASIYYAPTVQVVKNPLVILFLGFALVGFVDDFVVPRLIPGKRGLGWKQKLGLELLIAIGAFCLQNKAPGENSTPVVQIVLGVFLVLFFSNAYNFVDGMDGMAGGVGIVLLLTLFGMSYGMAFWTLPIVGALLPFLVLNAPPAKVFMGDVGSLPIGAVIGFTVFELLNLSTGEPVNWGTVAALVVVSLVMVVALVPVPLQILSVKLRKKRLFLMTPVHHAFQKKGIPETRIVWGYILAQLFCAAVALTIVAYTAHIDISFDARP